MKSQRKRITFKIGIPSVALRDLLQKAIFDETTHDALNKDARGLLTSHGITLDDRITDDILELFVFTIARARECMLKQSVKSEAFETIFNVITPPAEQKKVGVEEPDAGRAEARMLEVSSKQQKRTRGVLFYFSPKIESQLEEYLDRENTINFGRLRGDRVPLLDVFGLSSLITKMMIRLEEIDSP